MSSEKNSMKVEQLADRLHSVAIHLLRRVSREDAGSGLSPARLSVLSILVFVGPQSPGKLAEAERVKPPTMTKLLQGLEEDALIVRKKDPDDSRAQIISATAKEKRLLERARRRRIEALSNILAPINQSELSALEKASEILAELF